jgi:hypothetical protein
MTKTELKKKQEAEFDWRGLIGLEQVKSDLARLVDGGTGGWGQRFWPPGAGQRFA